MQAKEQEEEIFELQEISAHTNVLENSLQDISFMVSNDEKDIHIDEVDLSIAPHRIRLVSQLFVYFFVYLFCLPFLFTIICLHFFRGRELQI